MISQLTNYLDRFSYFVMLYHGLLGVVVGANVFRTPSQIGLENNVKPISLWDKKAMDSIPP
jgi:hypothetical protein